MVYSQKYTLVQFLEPVAVGSVFSMDEWPLHMTLADVFAINLSSQFYDNLASFLLLANCFSTEAGVKTNIGDKETNVTLIKNTDELQLLHNSLIDLLENHGAVFNSQQFNREGFLPHATLQQSRQIESGKRITIDELSLIDLFVDEDWTQRKILKSFELKSWKIA